MTVERFLIIRLGSLGDIVHALPAVAALRLAHPQARIDWVVERRWVSLLEGNPDVDRVIALDTLGFRRTPFSARARREFLASLKSLREARYTCAIDFQGLFKSALLAAWTGTARRIGFSEHFLREPGCAAFYSESVTPRHAGHVIAQNMVLVERLGAHAGGPETWKFPLPHSREADAYVAKQLAEHGIREFLVVNPGGGWLGKCWPTERYGMLSDVLSALHGWRCIVSFGPGEEPLVEAVRAAARTSEPVAFATDIPQLVALLRRTCLFIGGDTGPLHLAAALGTPVVGLYGATSPERNGPFSPDDVVVWNVEACRDTGRLGTRSREAQYTPSMTSITVDQVVEAVKQRIERVRDA